jgi:hypothetical protein
VHGVILQWPLVKPDSRSGSQQATIPGRSPAHVGVSLRTGC